MAGTAGAARNGLQAADTPLALVMNGDTHVAFDLLALFAAHHAGSVNVTLLLAHMPDDDNEWTPAGVYLMDRERYRDLSKGDLLDKLKYLHNQKLSRMQSFYSWRSVIHDIGTPAGFHTFWSGRDVLPPDRQNTWFDYLNASLAALSAVKCQTSITAAADLLGHTLISGGKILLCGNGGSLSDAQHFVTELLGKMMCKHGPPMAAIVLGQNPGYLTAVQNDIGQGDEFERELIALGNEGDVLIALSTSGRSLNVIRAIRRAREMRIPVITITGDIPGDLNDIVYLASIPITIPSTTPHIQEATMTILHWLAIEIETRIQ